MEPTANLSPSPIHKGTRDYVHKMMVAVESRLIMMISERLKSRDVSLCARIDKIWGELVTDRAKMRNEIQDIKSQLGELKGLLRMVEDLGASSPRPSGQGSPRENRYHTQAEIRQLILDNGHKFVPRKSFNGRHYADDLEPFVELRPGDKEVFKTGLTAWQTHVQTTMSEWRRNWATEPGFYGECPFCSASSREYKIKEGWKWPKQTA